MNTSDSSHTFVDSPSGSPGVGTDLSDDPRVVEVVRDYMAQLELGAKPHAAEYAARYPELAEVIGQCLEGLELVRGALPGEHSSSARGRAAAGVHAGPEVQGSPLGDFQIVRELARGGMGVVYEAVQLSLGRRVALKVLPFAATFDARQLQRFKNEAQAAALLHHTHIVPIYAVGCERGVHFYAMQLIEGQSLAEVIRQLREQAGLKRQRATGDEAAAEGADGHVVRSAQPQSGSEGANAPDEHALAGLRSTADVSAALTAGASSGSEAYFRRITRLMIQAAGALDHAHQLGVVHRDIKPANLLVNAAGNLWVTDFGLAQLQSEASLTRSGDVLGTFRYMSPEQTSGGRTLLDHRTDIYSLGATFYELLTLEPVFGGETRHELLFQILQQEPKRPRAVQRAVPTELETIVLKSLSKNAAERYTTAADFAADLQRYLDHQPIRARRPSLVDRLRKWSRRHPSVVVGGMLLLTLAAVGLSISNRMIAREQAKTEAALVGEKRRATEAEYQFEQARRAVDVLIQVSEEELADHGPMQGARQRLLETALVYYQGFVEQRRDNPASQAELETVERRVKGILRELEVLQKDMQFDLLTRPVVQADLKLQPEQRERLALLFPHGDERGPSFRSGPAKDEGERRRLVETAQSRERALETILTAQQLSRLRQIHIQRMGLFAFKEPQIVQQLQLTSEQRKQIREIEFEIFRRDLGPGGPGGRGGPHHGPGEFRLRLPMLPPEASVDRVLKVLNKEQVRRWQELVGPPVEGLHDRGGPFERGGRFDRGGPFEPGNGPPGFPSRSQD